MKALAMVVALLWAGCSAGKSVPATSTGPTVGTVSGTVSGGSTGGGSSGGTSTTGTGVSTGALGVLQFHGDGSRAGVYVDPAFTKSALAGLEPLPGFSASVDGAVFGQPLLVPGAVAGGDALIVATENDSVFAFDPDTGAQLWKVSLGSPATQADFNNTPCGTVWPLGITSTPIVDTSSNTVLLSGVILKAGAPRETIFALSLTDGSTRWTVDVSAQVQGFDSLLHIQRGALALLNGVLYVPYSGLAGDCGAVHGWVVAVPLANPSAAAGWKPNGYGSDIWGPSGVATDATSVYVSDSQNVNPQLPSPIWSDGESEAILRLSPGPTFSGANTDYFVPTDWYALDTTSSQLGAAGVVLFDQPSSTPSHLALAIGKTTDAYLVDRDDLGGIGGQVARLPGAASDWIEGAMAAYSTAHGTYVAMQALGEQPLSPVAGCPSGTDLGTLRVLPGTPPTLAAGWCAVQGGHGSPIATASGSNQTGDVVVWGLGTSQYGVSGSGLLTAFDGDTGAVLARSATPMTGLEHWISPIVWNGRLYVAGDTQVYAFDLAGPATAGIDAGPLPMVDAGLPSSCLPTAALDQVDPCAAAGYQCVNQTPNTTATGTCVLPGELVGCLPSVGCADPSLSCLPTLGGQFICRYPCASDLDCAGDLEHCLPGTGVDGGGSCDLNHCGPSLDAGLFFSACVGDAGPSTCLPYYGAAGEPIGLCLAAGFADGGCSGSGRDPSALCPVGQICTNTSSGTACAAICDVAQTFDAGLGGATCGAGETCILLFTQADIGVCLPNCSASSDCSGGAQCEEWNQLTGAEVCAQ